MKAFSSPEPTILLACGRNQEALGATISGMRHRCRLRETGWQNSVISFVISKWLLPELSIPAAGQKDRRLWGRECNERRQMKFARALHRDSVPLSLHSRPQSLRSFWPAAGIESSGSNHFEITKEITEFCLSGFTQSSSMAHAWNGCSAGQKDRRLWGREC